MAAIPGAAAATVAILEAAVAATEAEATAAILEVVVLAVAAVLAVAGPTVWCPTVCTTKDTLFLTTELLVG